jgi:uncharacterized protein (UPF0335 family)
MKYTKENFEKIFEKISEIHHLAKSGNFTLKAITSIILLLKNDMYLAKETDNELELKPYWYLTSFSRYYNFYKKKKEDKLEAL